MSIDTTWNPSTTEARMSQLPAVVATVIAHPEPSRIGDIAVLMDLGAKDSIEIQRLAPVFRDAMGAARGPLASGWLSRSGIVIETVRGSADLMIDPARTSMEVCLDGERLNQKVTIGFERLRDGVILELARYVALLLHARTLHFTPIDSLGLVGESEAMHALRESILRVCDLNVHVLVRGESGVGKELVAAAIHAHSARRDRPYVCVNMAAVPASVAASELFGHARGAFTGAAQAHDGYFVRADKGTLFLDEIGDVPDDVQPLLLRALESGEVQGLGMPKSRRVDVRVIAATDADLDSKIRAGRFRIPLLQRLSGYEITVPALRQRRDDIPRLFLHFLRDELARAGELEKLDVRGEGDKPWLPSRLMVQLVRYAFPGNVRELCNLARKVVIQNRGATHFRLGAALEHTLRAATIPIASTPPANAEPTLPPPDAHIAKKPAELDDTEIGLAWTNSGYRLDPAAEALGVSRSWLHTRLESCAGVRKSTELTRQEVQAALSARNDDLNLAAADLQVSPRALQLQRKRLGA